MTAHVEAMSTSGVSARSDRNRLVGRILTVFLMAWAVGLAFSLLVFVNRSLPTSIVAAGAALVIGLAGGGSARLLLRDSRRGLAAASGLAASVAGQLILGWLTFGVVGIRLAEAASSSPNWGGLVRVGLGVAAAALSLNAWRSPRIEPSLPTFPQLPSGPPEAAIPPVAPVRATAAPAHPRRRQQADAPRQQADAPRQQADAPRRQLDTPRWLATLGRVLPRWGRGRPRVRVSGRVDHRCPYCLDPVRVRDVRGIVTCPVCHTRHHADCWAVTGVCQVPHHHA